MNLFVWIFLGIIGAIVLIGVGSEIIRISELIKENDNEEEKRKDN